ncbi:MAG: hypothetical protein QW197_03795, partial [Candidatus Aenigmatarchaeota archaeon]
TIQSCSVENPKYFTGKNRIICRFYDPRDKGVRAEVWFNHDFYYFNNEIFTSKSSIFNTIKNFIIKMMAILYKNEN